MRPVTIYTTTFCGYCTRAKSILSREGVPYAEVDVSDDDDKRAWLVEATGQRTVPQIFFGEESVGGCTDLEKIVRAGQLKERLASPGASHPRS
jgi:glutaredoxin 3